MSNASIAAHLKSALAGFERGEIKMHDFERMLAGGFEALEGISYSELQELRDFEHLLVKSQFADEDSRFEPHDVVVRKLRHALDAIEQKG